jgi:phytoene dehydrogenase-like protein
LTNKAAHDAIVIGAGPNGLAAAIVLARAGRSVRVYESAATVGGSTRSAELMLPGFVHDIGAAVHTLVTGSPFLRTLPWESLGYTQCHPEIPFAHPLDDGTAVLVHRSVELTASALSQRDRTAYRQLMKPFVEHAHELMEALLGPLSVRHPLLLARFGLRAIQSSARFARHAFHDDRTRAMFAGVSAHSMVPLDELSTAGYALGLIISAHAFGWPVARGGSQHLGNAMAAHLRELGGDIVCDHPVASLAELPPSRATLCDVTPRQLLQLAGDRVPSSYARRLSTFRYGPGVFKMDWCLDEPVPWRAADCRRAGTVHLGGSFDEIAAAERDVLEGRHPEKPYVLLVQPSVFDATRAPEGKHTLWAYCHIPHGSTWDMTNRIEAQIERFAPGFRDCIRERHTMGPAELARFNPNIIGGDIGGGAGDLAQFFARPVASLDPYATAIEDVYLCSSSTPPGIGVHGMSGYHAAQSALRHSLS